MKLIDALPIAALALLTSCGSGVAEISISGTDEMLYEPRRFEVNAGQLVKLTLTNVGKMPKEGMAHNMVILKRGMDVLKWGEKLVPAGASPRNYYLPESLRGDAIIYIEKQLGPGESTSIEFTAPSEAGSYPFVCTFPGHYSKMNGTMKVR